MFLGALLEKLFGSVATGGKGRPRSRLVKTLIGKRKKKKIKYERDEWMKKNF